MVARNNRFYESDGCRMELEVKHLRAELRHAILSGSKEDIENVLGALDHSVMESGYVSQSHVDFMIEILQCENLCDTEHLEDFIGNLSSIDFLFEEMQKCSFLNPVCNLFFKTKRDLTRIRISIFLSDFSSVNFGLKGVAGIISELNEVHEFPVEMFDTLSFLRSRDDIQPSEIEEIGRLLIELRRLASERRKSR